MTNFQDTPQPKPKEIALNDLVNTQSITHKAL